MKIKTIEQLKELSRGNGCDCFIRLNGGLRSSKHIRWSGHFEIINEIDGLEQVLSEAELMDREFTNIGHAMLKGALIC